MSLKTGGVTSWRWSFSDFYDFLQGEEEEAEEWRRYVRQRERKKIIMTMVTLLRIAYALISLCICVNVGGEVMGE